MKTINFNSSGENKQWYVFNETGTARVELRGGGSLPADASIPTGKNLGYFDTLAEAQTAHPDAVLSGNAKEAKEYGVR